MLQGLMPALISIDLRKRIIHWCLQDDKTITETASLAGCCEKTVRNIVNLYLDTGAYINSDARAVGRPRILTIADKGYILSLLDNNPALYLDEVQDKL
ncbi:hypothetical protein BT96DRAFT_820691, partial [Gymnopus androsaceus JB14]